MARRLRAHKARRAATKTARTNKRKGMTHESHPSRVRVSNAPRRLA